MAQLNWSDYSEIRNALYRLGQGKEEMKAMANLPSKDQLKAVFQALEDWWGSEQPKVKGLIDTNYGQTTTAALAKKIFKQYVTFKLRGL